MSLLIGKYINAKLSGITATISALNKPANAEQLQNYIVVKRNSVTPEYTRDGVSNEIVSVQIDIVSSDYIVGIELAEQVRNIFELESDIADGVTVTGCTLLSADEETDGQVYVQSLTFEFQTK